MCQFGHSTQQARTCHISKMRVLSLTALALPPAHDCRCEGNVANCAAAFEKFGWWCMGEG